MILECLSNFVVAVIQPTPFCLLDSRCTMHVCTAVGLRTRKLSVGIPIALCCVFFVGFRDFPLSDLPMLEVLERTSQGVFVPLTVGGGIRGFTDQDGVEYSALEVAS